MYGNVAELSLDAYDAEIYYDRGKLVLNPFVAPEADYSHSVRGGSYDDDALYLRSAARFGSSEHWKMRDPQFPKSKWWHTDAPFLGFRIVRVPNPPDEEKFRTFWGPGNPLKNTEIMKDSTENTTSRFKNSRRVFVKIRPFLPQA